MEENTHSFISGDGNRQYKDALFKFIFGKPERAEYALSLYNALNDTDYTDKSKLKFVTLEDVLYLNYHNDVACMIDPIMINLWEEQSSWNPNMPIRFFLYIAGEWSDILYATNQDPTHSKLVTVPWPNCIVLYNGSARQKAVRKLSLRDNLPKERPAKVTDVNLEVLVYNINTKVGHELLSKCRPLYEYSWMISKVQKYTKRHKGEMTKVKLTNAIKRMIDKIPDDFVLAPLMCQKQEEVIKMLLTEFNAKRHDQIVFEDGETQGIAKGTAKRNYEIAKNLFELGTPDDIIIKATGLSSEEVQKIIKEAK